MGCLGIKRKGLSSDLLENLETPIILDNNTQALLPSSSCSLKDNPNSYIPLLYLNTYSISTVIPSFSNFITEYVNTSPYDHYERIENIGSGASSHIIKIKHKATDILRALKSIDLSKQNYLQVNDIINEINITLSLTHPNIMKVYDYYINNDKSNIDTVCEYISDLDLFDLMKKQPNNCFNEKTTLIIMKQLFSAVKHCHDNAIVYRDIKLENIMVSNINDFDIKLIDFGTARRLNKNEMCSKKIGTPHYMAPEIVKGEQYDYKCDLWSLGVLMYYLLYGTKPFQGETNEELFANIIKGDVKLNTNNISISNECKQLLMRLLEVDPYKRININDSLHSEWILQCNSNNNINGFILEHKELIILIKNNIETISIQNKIQIAFLSYVINFDNVLDKNIYYQLFNYFDRDGDGLLSKNELLNGLTILYENNTNKSQSICDKLFAIFTDINNTNSFINIDQFIIACINRKELITNKHIQSTFMCLDKYKQGKLTYDVMKAFLMKNSQQIINDVIVDDIWKECNMESKESEMVYAKFSQIIKGIM